MEVEAADGDPDIDEQNPAHQETLSETSISTQTCLEDMKDKRLLASKAFYGVFLAGVAFIAPYLPVFFKINGMTATDNGLLGGLRPLVNFWSGPLWSVIADKLQRRKLILFMCVILYSIFTFTIWFVPAAPVDGCGDESACVAASNATTTSPTLPTNYSQPEDVNNTATWQTSTALITSHSAANSANTTTSANPNAVARWRTFAIFAVLIFLGEFAGAPIQSLADTICLETLGKSRVSQFGRQRLWAAVGYGLANLAAGFGASSLADSCGRGNYTVHFVGFIILVVLSSAITLGFEDTSHVGSKRGRMKSSEIHVGRGLRLALLNVRAISFLVAVFFLAIAMSILDNFVFWFLIELCATELLLGLSVLVMCSAEVPLFVVAGSAIKRFGHPAVLVFVFLCYGIRFLSYSLLHNPWLVLPIEPLHGVTFALMWSCSVSYAKKIAPLNLEATMQGVLNSVFWGVGRATGAIVGGVLYSRVGPRFLFRSAGIAMLLLGALFAIVEMLIRQREQRQPPRAEDRLRLMTEIELTSIGLDETVDGGCKKSSGQGLAECNATVLPASAHLETSMKSHGNSCDDEDGWADCAGTDTAFL